MLYQNGNSSSQRKITIKLNLWFIFIYISIFPNLLSGQENNLRFKHLTVEEGLSQSWVRCITQDKFGYIWIGTDDGLNRYDGYQIVTYKYYSKKKNTLSNNVIRELFIDSKGNLWIGTANGLNLYDRKNDNFLQNPDLPGKQISAIVEDKGNNLWIGTTSNLYYYNTRNKIFTEYSPKNINGIGIKDIGYLSSSNITDILIDSKSNIWICTNEGLNLFNKKTHTFINYYHIPDNPGSLGDDEINCIFEDQSGRIWIGHKDGLDLITGFKDILSFPVFRHFKNINNNSYSINKGRVTTITEYNKQLWVGIENGGLSFLKLSENNEIEDRFVHCTYNSGELNGLNNNSIYCQYIDKQNNIWIGTYGNGLNIYSPFANNFRLFRNDPKNVWSISSNQVNAFLEDGNIIWIGTEMGLNRYDRNSNRFNSFTNNPNDNSSISSNAVWTVCKDIKKNIWIGTWAGGLNKFDPNAGKFTHYRYNSNDSNSLGSDNVFAIHEDKQGKLWLGTMGGGLTMFDPETRKFARYNLQNSGIYSNYVESIDEDYSGNLWIASLSAVVKFNKSAKTFENYRHENDDTTSVSGSKIFVVFCDSKSNIWVGTDVGLNLYQPLDNNFISYQVQDGLPDNSVKSIAEDKLGNLWLGTNRGLSQFKSGIFRPKKPQFINYSYADGLQNNEFNRRSCLITSDSILFFGGENGFVTFNPSKILHNKYVPEIIFTDFLLFNKSIKDVDDPVTLEHAIYETKEIKLRHNQTVFTIKFVAFNYVIPEKNQYTYMLEGFDEGWNFVGTKREATYTNLGAGKYIFKVKASNNDGVWNEKGISLNIIILPPWWGTWWFRIFMIAIIVGIIGYFSLNIINKFKHLTNITILDEKNQLKTLIDNLPFQIFIKDNKLHYITANYETLKSIGLKSEKDIVDKTDYDFYPKDEASINFIQEREIINSGFALINEEIKKDINGESQYYSITKCPILNTNSEIIGLVGIIRNITEQKLVEEKIIKQTDELMSYNQLLNETNALLEERQQQVEEQSSELTAQNDLLLEKQKYIIEQSAALEMVYLQLIEEHKAQKETLKELKMLNSTKDKFFSIIAHDLKNPFATIIGFAELIKDNYQKIESKKLGAILNHIYTSSSLAYDLLENLLVWAHSQKGDIEYRPEIFDFRAMVIGNIKFVENQAMRKQIRVDMTFNEEIPVYADKNMMSSVMRNLLTNSIKFSHPLGKVKISAIKRPGLVEILVADNGTGISDEIKNKLFRIEEHVTFKGTDNEKGTGLGLNLCKEFIERHRGKIWVESEVNVGSVFHFTIPESKHTEKIINDF